jgi:hypothetical protein
MKPRQRPTALCPQCERPVILKLGPVRKHHAAHHPGEVCSATQPESALHISVKCHIADELRRAGSARIPLIVVERCAVGRSVLVATSETLSPHELSSSPCDATQEHLAALTWDDVVVERRIAGHDAEDSTLARTPDIVLLNASVPILAIEVFVTHRVDQIKAEALAALGVPWAEVRADPSSNEFAAWTCDLPLPIAQRSGLGLWRCPKHQQEYDEWLKNEARRREEESREREARLALAAASEKRKRELLERLEPHTTTVRGVRIADFYLPGGQRRRRYYFVTEDSSGQLGRHIALVEGESTVASWTPDFESEESKRAVWQALRVAWTNDCSDLQREEQSTMDSPMRWLHGPRAVTIAMLVRTPTRENARALVEAFPPRFEFRPGRGWVCRDGFQDLSWDGQEGETVRAHPSAARSGRDARLKPRR